jgi:hypothetical protein
MKLPHLAWDRNGGEPSHPSHHSDPPHYADLIALTGAWCSRTRAVERAHFRRSVKFRSQHIILGSITIVLSSLLGVLTHDPVRDSASSLYKIGLLLSVIVPVLTALVAFLRFDERSAMHQNSAAKFAALKRKLQMHYTERLSNGHGDDNVQTTLSEVCRLWDELTIQSPALYKSDWPEIASYDKYLMSFRADAEASGHVPPANRGRQSPAPSSPERGSLSLRTVGN